MDEVIKWCRKNKDVAIARVLTSLGALYCISSDKYVPFVIKICENISNLEVFAVYFHIIGMADTYYLTRNNGYHKDDDTSHFSRCYDELNEEQKAIANEFIKEYFNDEYKEIFRKEFGFGGTTY